MTTQPKDFMSFLNERVTLTKDIVVVLSVTHNQLNESINCSIKKGTKIDICRIDSKALDSDTEQTVYFTLACLEFNVERGETGFEWSAKISNTEPPWKGVDVAEIIRKHYSETGGSSKTIILVTDEDITKWLKTELGERFFKTGSEAAKGPGIEKKMRILVSTGRAIVMFYSPPDHATNDGWDTINIGSVLVESGSVKHFKDLVTLS